MRDFAASPPTEREMVQIATIAAWIWLIDFQADFWLGEPSRPNVADLRRHMRFHPTAFNCSFAEHDERKAVARWMRDDLEPATRDRVIEIALEQVTAPWREVAESA
jgi:hypothetical protein